MPDCVLDTHALFWFLTKSPKLGKKAAQIFQDATKGQGLLWVPSIVLAELYFLNEKQGHPLDFNTEYQAMAASPCYRFVDFTAADVLQFAALSSIPEIHDRLIVGAALSLGLPVMTRDINIINSGVVVTIW